MDFFKKLITAIRGGSREIGDAIIDSQGIRIYEQEIEDAKSAIRQAEEDLTGVMAKDMQTGREIERLEDEISGYEKKALELLDKGEDALAEEVAGKIAELEAELENQKQAKTRFAEHVTQVKEVIQQTHAKIREHEREIAMVKTTENVQKATRSISQHMNGGSSRMVAAKESLERIKKRQQDTTDRMTAAEALRAELSGATLEEKLKAAGIGDGEDRRKAVLGRLKAKQQG
jgi:phage shock protein A